MKSLLLLFCFFIGLFESPPPETTVTKKINYIITQKGKTIGHVRATKQTINDEVEYDVETAMDVKILLTQHIKYQSTVKYKDGVLQNSTSKAFVNGKLHQTCIVTRKDGQYKVISDKQTSIINDDITYSGVLLYFAEPKNTTTVFSEMTGQVNAVKKTGEANFVLTDAKSHKQNYYWYKNGMLDRAYLNHALVDIQIKRTN